MINTMLKYDKIIINGLELEDYTSKKYYNIHFMEELSDDAYVDYYQLQNDEKIETVSYKLYNSPDYWDMLLLINNMSPLFDMTYNYDLTADCSEDFVNTYANDVYVTGDLTEEYIAQLKVVELERHLICMEEKRTIKVIRPSSLQSFLKKAREKGYI